MAKKKSKSAGSNAAFVTTIVVVVLVGMVFAVAYSLYSKKDTTGQAGSVPRNAFDNYYLAIGPANAPHTVKVFEDFQCPYCQAFEAAAGSNLQQAAKDGKIRLLYHPMAFLDQSSTTQYSSRALNAFGVVLDTAGPDAALLFHNILYENQPAEGTAGLSNAQLIGFAMKAGAKESDITSGIDNEVFKQWVVNATNDASQKEGVVGTPTIKIDGKLLKYTSLQDLLQKLYAATGVGV